MKMHVDIDDHLLADAMLFGPWQTKKEAVNEALAVYVRSIKRRRLLEIKGKVAWHGDLDAMRTMRPGIVADDAG
jgi:Arc/MetJ family transcription regulator